jgi:hypothetical protein
LSETTKIPITAPENTQVTSLADSNLTVSFSTTLKAIPPVGGWGKPPLTETATPGLVLFTSGTTVTLSFSKLSIFGVEISTNNFGTYNMTADFYNGATKEGTITLPINGEKKGAELFAATTTDQFTSVVLSAEAGSGGILFAQVRYAQPVQPPTVTCSVAESLLWPLNQKLDNVGLSVHVTPPGATLKLLIYGNDNASPNDAANIGPGTLQLRSQRQGNGDGRVYLIVAQASNAAGTTSDVCAVTVPHDQSTASIQEVQQQATAAEASYPTLPAGFTLIGQSGGGAAASRLGGRTHANDVSLPQESLLLSGGLQVDGTNHSLAPLTATTTAPNQPALDQVFSRNSGSTAVVLSDETKAFQLDRSLASWVDPLSEHLADKLVTSLVPLA